MYVRRCPRISSSRTPPATSGRTRGSALLGDRLADRRLARAGQPDQRQDRPGPLVGLDPALLAELRDGDVLVDQSLTSSRPAWSASRISRVRTGSSASSERVPTARCEQPVEVAPDHLRLRRKLPLCARSGRALLGLLAHGLGHARLLDLRPVLLDHGGVVLAEAGCRVHLLRRRNSRCCFSIPALTSSRIRCRICISEKALRWNESASSSRSATSIVSSSSTFWSKLRSGE